MIFRFRNMSLSLISCVLLLGVFFISGCRQGGVLGENSHAPSNVQENSGDARLSVFLQLKEAEGPNVWMRISNLEVGSFNTWFPVTVLQGEVQAQEISSNGQIIVGRGGIPLGRYQSLRFTVEKPSLDRNGEKKFLSVENPLVKIDFPTELTIAKGDSTSLFITWDASGSMAGGDILNPKMAVAMQSAPIVSDLAYVACPDIDTVYLIRTDRNMVCSSVGISGKPTSLVINKKKDRFYVLAPKEPAVKIYELTANRLIDQIRIPLSIKATYMTISPNGKRAYLLDEIGNSVSLLNLEAGSIDKQVRVGSRPKHMLYLEDEDLLAVSCAYAQKVYFLDTTNLTTVATVDTGGTPDGMVAQDKFLYVAESSSNSLSVFEYPGGVEKNRVNVGVKPRRLVSANSHIYIANYGSNSISVLRPGQLNPSRSIRVAGVPFEMDVSLTRQWLYVGDINKKGITVIDLSSNKIAGWIGLDTVPDSVVIVEQ